MKIYSILLIIVFCLTINIFAQVEFTSHTITTDADNARSVFAIDMDGDGDIDVLSASQDDDKIAWYENDGNENFTTHIITLEADGASSVYAIDFDDDGDVDVIYAAANDDQVAWYENDGDENFDEHLISESSQFAISVHAADIDGDGDLDVLTASAGDDKIVWEENVALDNYTSHTITNSADNVRSVYAADIDGDGDMDVLGASTFGVERVAWYENDGSGNFTTHIIANNRSSSVNAIDIDGDGDMDVIAAAHDIVLWYENDGNGNFLGHGFDATAPSAKSAYAADIDGDGDIDVFYSANDDVADNVGWYENDGDENFTHHTIRTGRPEAFSIYAIDIDNDGDMDAVTAEIDGIAWYENLRIASVESISNEIPTEFSLSQNYPNPFNPSTSIQFSLPQSSYVTLEVFNTLGERVGVLASEELSAGTYNYSWDASNLTSGIYFYKIQAGSFVEIKKMTLLK